MTKCHGLKMPANAYYFKDGTEFMFDYRNAVQSLFIRKNNGDREVIGVGGVGSSGQREINTFFTAVFYILGKKTRIPHFLLRYKGILDMWWGF